MAKGDPSLPDIPGYDVRVSGGSSIPSIDTYTPVASPVQQQFAEFSNTLMKYTSVKTAEQNETALEEGRAWRRQSQKTFKQAVAAGEIDATQNPWFTVGAMEIDGSLAATDLTSKINAGWNQITNDSNDTRGRDPEAFTKYYEDEVSKFVDTAEVDSHYWKNAFFKGVTSWHTQKAGRELTAAQGRLYTYESNRAVDLIGAHLIAHTNGTEGSIEAAQEVIESLNDRGMWGQDLKANVADRLNTIRQSTENPTLADEFYNGLKTGPNGSKLADDPYYINSAELKGKSIESNRQTRNRTAAREQRANLMARVRSLSDVTFVARQLDKDPNWFNNELSAVTKHLDDGLLTDAEWEGIKVALQLSERNTPYEAGELATESKKSARELEEAEALGTFYSRVHMLDDEDYWTKQAKDAGATGANLAAKIKELQEKEKKALTEQIDDFVAFQDAGNLTDVISQIRTRNENFKVEWEQMQQALVMRHAAQTTYNTAINTLVSSVFDVSTGAVTGSIAGMGERVDELYGQPEFAEQMDMLGISPSDIKKRVDRMQRDALLAAWGNEEALKQYATQTELDEGLSPDDVWYNVANRVVDMRGEDMPALRRAMYQQMVQFFNGYDAVKKDEDGVADSESLAALFNGEVGRLAVRNLELAYSLSDKFPGRKIGTQQHVFGDGNSFINQYITDRDNNSAAAPEDIVAGLLTRTAETLPKKYLSPTQGAALQAAIAEKTDPFGFDGGPLDRELPQYAYIYRYLSHQIEGRISNKKGTSAGYDPVTQESIIINDALGPAIISDSGNLFMPDGGKGGFEAYDLGSVYSEHQLDQLGNMIIDNHFVYDVTSAEYLEQMGMLRQQARAKGPKELDMFDQTYNTLKRVYGENMDSLAALGIDKANLVITPLKDDDGQIFEMLVVDPTRPGLRLPSIPMTKDVIDDVMAEFREANRRPDVLPSSFDLLSGGR